MNAPSAELTVTVTAKGQVSLPLTQPERRLVHVALIFYRNAIEKEGKKLQLLGLSHADGDAKIEMLHGDQSNDLNSGLLSRVARLAPPDEPVLGEDPAQLALVPDDADKLFMAPDAELEADIAGVSAGDLPLDRGLASAEIADALGFTLGLSTPDGVAQDWTIAQHDAARDWLESWAKAAKANDEGKRVELVETIPEPLAAYLAGRGWTG